jgi:hypothetical protein
MQTGQWNATITRLGGGIIAGTWTDTFNGGPSNVSGSFDGTTAQWTSDGTNYRATYNGSVVLGTTDGPLCQQLSVHGSFQGTGACP